MLTNRFRISIAVLVLAIALPARADAPTAQPLPPPVPEDVSIQAWGERAPDCIEWSNACQVCRRDAAGKPQCSTPGIACQPIAPICKTRKTP